MKTNAQHARLLGAVAAGLAAVAPVLAAEPSTPPARSAPDLVPSTASRTLTTQFSYTATVPASPVGTKALDVWLPVPSDSPWQTVSNLTVAAPAPYQITRETKFGDRMVYLHDTSPAIPLSVTVRFTVKRREVRLLDTPRAAAVVRETGFPSAAATLEADTRVPVGGRFQTISRQVTQGQKTTLDKERALFDSVESTMRYDYKKQSPEYAQGDAAFVCDYKSGNCSDLHSYLIALSRSIGTPALLEFGFPSQEFRLTVPRRPQARSAAITAGLGSRMRRGSGSRSTPPMRAAGMTPGTQKSPATCSATSSWSGPPSRCRAGAT